jgi:hypothetical protein
MIKPPQEVIDIFFKWYKKDVHSKNEDYYREAITLNNLSGLSRSEFIEFFYNFAHEGGRVQSGGYRTSKQFRETIKSQYEQYRPFILTPFEAKFDEVQWLNSIDDFKNLGKGLATIYLNRVDKNRFPILNNKTANSLALFDIKLPTNLVRRYKAVRDAQQQLIDWFPKFENFYRTDALNQFLIGDKEGKELAAKLLPKDEGNNYWVFQANPGIYDLIGALRDDALRAWTVNQHKKEIKEGDKVIIWMTGTNSGCYGLATVISEVHEIYQDPEDVSYYIKKPAKESPRVGVEIRIDENLWNKPVLNSSLNDIKEFSNFPAGRQGTNFKITKIHFNLIEDLVHRRFGKVDTSPMSLPGYSLNTILYGPPGTGKTWKLRTEYMDRFTDTSATLSQEEYAASIVSDLAWWKVITMVMMDLKESRVSEIMKHPLMQARIKRSSSANPRAAIWAHIQMHTKEECQNVKYTKRYEPLLFEKDDKSVWSIDLELAEEAVPELKEKLEAFNSFEPGKPTKVERYDFTTFHQSFSYEDFVEGIKPIMPAEDATEEVPDSLSYEVRPGIFKKMVQRALADPKNNYALFIDEINRGNVASIFGELITLIEEDKRQGADHELTATLPYSQTKFVVPKNLYIIGAMNTADRSVEALDTALRRRFTFIAVPPEPETLPSADEVEGLNVDLRKMLQTINARIQKLLDKDHCIGHSYFLGVSSFEDLQEVFVTKILPLLEEYFYGDPARIGRVLGEKFVSRNYESINWASGDWGQEEFDERSIYIIKDPRSLSQEDFKSIYE